MSRVYVDILSYSASFSGTEGKTGFKITPAGFAHASNFCPQNILLLLAKDHLYIPKAGTEVQFASINVQVQFCGDLREECDHIAHNYYLLSSLQTTIFP